ncbi:MAG: CheB methylesterase domain-containing protein [Defluviitaleaceae bacterium]|nr:CheB methylesterase domain-containing protein [Defluviitaleaceae bacterium]
MKPNLLILSTDSNIKSFLRVEFAKHGINMNTNANSIFAVPNLLQTDRVNILILDTDTVAAPPDAITGLIVTHGLYIIIMGIKNAAAAVAAGVKGVLSKPEPSNNFAHRILFRNILDKIEVHMRTFQLSPMQGGGGGLDSHTSNLNAAEDIHSKVVAIAASTGGTEALFEVLRTLPANVPPILIVQHMPSVFTHQFAGRLDQASKFAVKEAAIRDIVKKNQALIAPGGLHMKAVKKGKKLAIECYDGPKVHGVIPSADVLFNSMAEFMGKNVIGVVLTGMGSDGARGLFKLKSKGATIIAQDKATSVVYGMPKAAVDLGIVDYELPLNKIAEKIVSLI